jgi:hypothetical protein
MPSSSRHRQCRVENLDTRSLGTPSKITQSVVLIEHSTGGMLVAEYFTPTLLGRFHTNFTA